MGIVLVDSVEAMDRLDWIGLWGSNQGRAPEPGGHSDITLFSNGTCSLT